MTPGKDKEMFGGRNEAAGDLRPERGATKTPSGAKIKKENTYTMTEKKKKHISDKFLEYAMF